MWRMSTIPVISCSAPIGRWTATQRSESCSCSWPSARKKSARSRSSMLMKSRRAIPSSSARFQTRDVPTSTPITPLRTTSAPSTTRSEERARPETRRRRESIRLSFLLLPLRGRARARWTSSAGARRRPSRRRSTPLDGAQPVCLAGLEEQRLDERRLARAAVAHDGDVADLARLENGHTRLPPRLTGYGRES